MHSAFKVKKIDVQVVSLEEKIEKNPECQARNYGILAIVRQLKSSRVHKMYTEVREISRCAAVEKLIDSVCGQYSIDRNQVNICQVEEITDESKLKKTATLNFTDKKCAFPKAAKTSTLQDRRFKGVMSFRPIQRR